MNYYCLIAGLRDLDIEDNKLTFSVADFKEEVYPQLSADDKRLMNLFYMKFDNQNLLRYLKDKDAQHDERGNISRKEIEQCLKPVDEDEPQIKFSLPYFNTFLSEYNNIQQVDVVEPMLETLLAELYYVWAMKCGNRMISKWFEYNMNLNNILSAYTSRKYKIEIDVVGDNEIAEAIKTSNQRDFGLTGIFEDLDVFHRLTEEPDLFVREKNIDLLRWQWLDEQNVFNYFSIEVLFAYLIKLEIIERWVSLNHEQGEKIFRELINSLKDSVVNQKL